MTESKNPIDLGSVDHEDFNPFATDDELDEAPETTTTHATPPTSPALPAPSAPA